MFRKHSKFGRMQKIVLRELLKGPGGVCTFTELYPLIFPAREYNLSYLSPILMRLVCQQIVKVNWGKQQVQLKGSKYEQAQITRYTAKRNA